MALGAAPDRQRGAPVPAAGERPVDVVVQPVPVAAPLDRLGVPVGRLVLPQQGVLDRGGPDVPRRLGVVEQRGVAAPAVRVGVLVGDVAEQQPALVQVPHQVGVGVLEELAADQWHVRREVAVGADRVDHRQPVATRHRHVVRAEGGRLVDQPGAVLDGDVVGEHDVVGRLTARVVGELDQLEGPVVAPALHRRARDPLDHLPALAECRLQQRLGDDEPLGAVGGDDVLDLGVNRDRGVRHQRPRGRRPDQQRGLPGQRAGGEGEAHVDRRVGHGLVALGELVVGQAGAAARAVRRDAVVLDEQSLGVDLLERPPDRLDVRGAHRLVGVVHVDPVAHPRGHLGETVDVAQHRLAALGVELRDPVGLDVALAAEAELLLHRQLDRETVAVPAGLPLHHEALHGLEPGEDVLEDTRLDVVGARHPVGGGRSLVEGPARGVGAVVPGERPGEGVVGVPEAQDVALHGGKVDLGWDGGVLGHRWSFWLATRRSESRPVAEGTMRRPWEGRARGTTLLGDRPAGGRPLVVPAAAGSTPAVAGSSGGSGVIFGPDGPRAPTTPRVAAARWRTYSSHQRRAAGQVCQTMRRTRA